LSAGAMLAPDKSAVATVRSCARSFNCVIRWDDSEDRHGCRPSWSSPETGRRARRNGDVLLAADLICHDTAVDRPSGIVPKEHRPVAGVKDEEVALEFAGEQEVG